MSDDDSQYSNAWEGVFDPAEKQLPQLLSKHSCQIDWRVLWRDKMEMDIYGGDNVRPSRSEGDIMINEKF